MTCDICKRTAGSIVLNLRTEFWYKKAARAVASLLPARAALLLRGVYGALGIAVKNALNAHSSLDS
jgi:hypothetical protein